MEGKQHEQWNGKYAAIFDGETVSPPEHIWENIEAEIFKETPNRRGIFLWFSGAAAVFIVGIMLYTNLGNDTVHETPSITGNSTSVSTISKTPVVTDPTKDLQSEKKPEIHQPKTAIPTNGDSSIPMNPYEKDSQNAALDETLLAMEAQLPILAFEPIPLTYAPLKTTSCISIPAKMISPEKWALSTEIAIGKNVRYINDGFEAQKSIHGKRSDRAVPLNMVQFGGRVHYNLSNRWELKTGLSYATASSYSKWSKRYVHASPNQGNPRFLTSEGFIDVADAEINSALGGGDSLELNLRSRQKVSFLSIPLLVSRTTSKGRFTTSINTGISLDFQLHSDIRLEANINSEVRSVDTQLAALPTRPSLQGIVGGELRYQITPQLSAVGQANLSVPLTSYLKTSDFKVSSGQLGLGVGLRVSI